MKYISSSAWRPGKPSWERKIAEFKDNNNVLFTNMQTTGLNENTHQIIDISIINLKDVILLNTLVKNDHYYKSNGLLGQHEVHGILETDINEVGRTLSDVCDDVSRIMPGCIVIMYNMDFYKSFLKKGFSDFNKKSGNFYPRCLQELCTEFFSDYNLSLKNVCEMFDLMPPETNRALSYSQCYLRIFKYIINTDFNILIQKSRLFHESQG